MRTCSLPQYHTCGKLVRKAKEDCKVRRVLQGRVASVGRRAQPGVMALKGLWVRAEAMAAAVPLEKMVVMVRRGVMVAQGRRGRWGLQGQPEHKDLVGISRLWMTQS